LKTLTNHNITELPKQVYRNNELVAVLKIARANLQSGIYNIYPKGQNLQPGAQYYQVIMGLTRYGLKCAYWIPRVKPEYLDESIKLRARELSENSWWWPLTQDMEAI